MYMLSATILLKTTLKKGNNIYKGYIEIYILLFLYIYTYICSCCFMVICIYGFMGARIYICGKFLCKKIKPYNENVFIIYIAAAALWLYINMYLCIYIHKYLRKEIFTALQLYGFMYIHIYVYMYLWIPINTDLWFSVYM